MSNTIFNRAMPAPNDHPPAPTIQEVISRVRQPRQLAVALEGWRAAQREYAALAATLREATSQLQRAGGDGAANVDALIKNVHQLDIRLKELASTTRGALADVLAARPPWISSVTAAVEPYRRAAARRGLAAVQALQSALDLLDEVDAELVAIGGSRGRPALPQHRATLIAATGRLREIAGLDT